MYHQNPKTLTLSKFVTWLRERGVPSQITALFLKYPDVVEPYLPQMVPLLPRMERNLRKMGNRFTQSHMLGPRLSVAAGSKRGFGSQARSGKLDAFEAPSAGYDRAEASRPLTDREAWTELAGLVDSALSSEPEALREALKAAFLDEARKAA